MLNSAVISIGPGQTCTRLLVESLLVDNWVVLGPTVINLGRRVGHDQQMTPVDFEVIGSKVKVTVTLNTKSLSD